MMPQHSGLICYGHKLFHLMKHTLFRDSFLNESIEFVICVRSTLNLIYANEKNQLEHIGHGSHTLQAHD